MKIEMLRTELERARNRLSEYIRTTPEEPFYAKTETDRWSIAEAAHHICIVNHALTGRIQRLLDEETISRSTDRPTEVPIRRELRELDPQWVLENVPAAASSEPSNDRSKPELLRAVDDDFGTIMFLLQTGMERDLRELRAENKIFGSLSYYEWLYFILVHTKTHLYQIERELERAENTRE